ncbi:peptidase inhibitor family I36 protein [Micromonospora sp. NPDC047465]|uniref:peptidase inhibitor family I36 protein n=1 Tax=Micromonospora sp. NPDC047465 TaxID=3154813 RepID=UPI0033C76B21
MRTAPGGRAGCAVLSRTEVRCYASREEEKADLASLATPTGASRGTVGPIGTLGWNGCDEDWLCIYEHADFEGRKLSFNDEYWHDLDNWGFVDMTSSFTNYQGGNLIGGCSGTDSGTLECCGCSPASTTSCARTTTPTTRTSSRSSPSSTRT